MQAEIDQAAAQLENFDLAADIEVEVRTQALLNPLILVKVLSYLDVPTLKSARLVCTFWADVATKHLGKKGFLTVYISPDRSRYEALTSFNPELGKNIKLLFMTCYCNDACTCSPNLADLPFSLVTIFSGISDKLETLEFFSVKTFQPLQEIWATCHFPNLTRISILADGKELDKNVPSRNMAEFQALPNLNVFTLKISPSFRKRSASVLMSTISQKLINSAPNLEEIGLDATFYLDLTPCRKLKKMSFKYCSSGGFKVSGMAKMLESCRNSLENLSLDYISRKESVKRRIHLPNVTHLTLNAYAADIIKNSVNVPSLPKLKHFAILNNSSIKCDTYQLLQRHRFRHAGITSLDLGCTYRPQLDEQVLPHTLVKLFSAVKELKLNLMIEFYGNDDQNFVLLRERMRSLGDWELTHGQVEVEMGSYLALNWHDRGIGSELVIALLGGMAGWRGLANTSLQFNGYRRHHAEFRLSDGMRDALQSCRTIRSVTITGFLMDEKTKDNFQAFIGEHDLPISIK